MKLEKLLLRALAFLAVGSFIVSQLGRVSLIADMLNAFLVPLICAFIVIFILALVLRDRLVALAAFAGGAAAAIQLLSVVLSSAPREPAAGPALHVVSINAFHDNPDPARLVKVVKQAHPDILLVQEAAGSPGAAVLGLLPGYSRVWSCGAPPCSLAIVSRWPATRIDHGRQDGSLPDLLIARVRAPFGDIDVAALHLPRMNRPEAEPFAVMVTSTLSALQGVPLLVGGDFNRPTGSFALTRFEQLTGLRRAERWVPTYPADRPIPPIATIDHIYLSAAWRVQDCHRLAASGSDHFGLDCTVALRSAAAPGD